MSSRIRHVTIDCADPWTLAHFWASVLEGQVTEFDEPGDDDALVELHRGPHLLFQRTPDAKVVKNRVHFDVQPRTGTRDEEVDRLLELGATMYDDRRASDGTGWATLLDIEGNEFCVERSAAERGEG